MYVCLYVDFGHSHVRLAPCCATPGAASLLRRASAAGVAAGDVSQPGDGGGVAGAGNVDSAAQPKGWERLGETVLLTTMNQELTTISTKNSPLSTIIKHY